MNQEQHLHLPDRWVLVCETALDVGHGKDVRTGGRPELGYALVSDSGTFATEQDAQEAPRDAQLPLGWVIMPLSRLLPDLYQVPTPVSSVPDTTEQQPTYEELAARLEESQDANLSIAMLLLDNDRTKAVKWAKGLVLSTDSKLRVDPTLIKEPTCNDPASN